MKIEKELKDFDTVRFSMCLYFNEKHDSEGIIKLLDETKIEYKFYNLEKRSNIAHNFYISIDLEKYNEDLEIFNRLRNLCENSEISIYDIKFYCSITSEYDHGGFTISSEILEICSLFKRPIEISYIVY